MRGLGAFQMAQMKHRDARVSAMCQHLREAITLWEEISHMPFQKPEPAPKAAPEEPLPPPAPPQELPPQKLTYTMKEAAAAIGIGRTTLHKAIASGELRAVKLGNRTLIPGDALRSWLDALPAKKR